MNSLSTVFMPSESASFAALSTPMREIGTGMPIKASLTSPFVISLIERIATGISTEKSNPVEQNISGAGFGGWASFGHTAPANHNGTLPRLDSAITGPYVDEKLELIIRITFS